jgi:hypothetical protein
MSFSSSDRTRKKLYKSTRQISFFSQNRTCKIALANILQIILPGLVSHAGCREITLLGFITFIMLFITCFDPPGQLPGRGSRPSRSVTWTWDRALCVFSFFGEALAEMSFSSEIALAKYESIRILNAPKKSCSFHSVLKQGLVRGYLLRRWQSLLPGRRRSLPSRLRPLPSRPSPSPSRLHPSPS